MIQRMARQLLKHGSIAGRTVDRIVAVVRAVEAATVAAESGGDHNAAS